MDLNIRLLPYGLLQNPAYSLHVDIDSTLVVAGPMLSSRRTGITLFDRHNSAFSYIESGLSGEFPPVDVNCLESDSAYIYAGTPQGIYVINRTDHRISDRIDRRNGLSDENIVSLIRVGDSLFVGTTSGLTLLTHHPDSVSYIGRQQFFNQTIYDLDIVDGYLWIASSIGAYRVSLATGKLQEYKDPDAVLVNRAFAVRHYGNFLWLASDIGMVRINLETGRTEPFLITSQKLDGRAMAVNDKVAAVSSDRGLTLVFHNRDNPVIRDFSTEDGLASDYIYALLLDGDYLWVGSDRGLTRFWWNNPRRID
jgi:ligand-binding sensor domain-containing protein